MMKECFQEMLQQKKSFQFWLKIYKITSCPKSFYLGVCLYE
jgi:hypothetical protein